MYILYIIYLITNSAGQMDSLDEVYYAKYTTMEECWANAEKIINPDIFTVRCQLEE